MNAPEIKIVEFVEELAGIYFRSIFLPFKGTTIPQHTHDEDHATYVGQGSARLYVDGLLEGDIEAGHAVLIKAGKRHVFEALEDDTRLTCVWSLEAAMRLKDKGL
jgi:quercetin dioxygenase-like cupin family protein